MWCPSLSLVKLLGEVLAELMAAHGLKQEESVDIFGSEAAVSYAVQGKRNLKVDQIPGLAAKSTFLPRCLSERRREGDTERQGEGR
jgi:hypothetical protein